MIRGQERKTKARNRERNKERETQRLKREKNNESKGGGMSGIRISDGSNLPVVEDGY